MPAAVRAVRRKKRARPRDVSRAPPEGQRAA
jgi:hypothetical protein